MNNEIEKMMEKLPENKRKTLESLLDIQEDAMRRIRENDLTAQAAQKYAIRHIQSIGLNYPNNIESLSMDFPMKKPSYESLNRDVCSYQQLLKNSNYPYSMKHTMNEDEIRWKRQEIDDEKVIAGIHKEEALLLKKFGITSLSNIVKDLASQTNKGRMTCKNHLIKNAKNCKIYSKDELIKLTINSLKELPEVCL